MHITYPVKHWAASLLISPIFLVIYDSVINTNFVLDMISIYLLFVMMGAIISLPGLALYIYLYNKLVKSELNNNQIRLIMTPVAAIMAILALWLIKGSLMIPMMLSYFAGVLTSGLIFRTGQPS